MMNLDITEILSAIADRIDEKADRQLHGIDSHDENADVAFTAAMKAADAMRDIANCIRASLPK